MTNQEKYNQKLKRFQDAIAMKEPDCVPMIPFVQTYNITRYGHTMAEIMYDVSGAKDAVKKYLDEYDPDVNYGYGSLFAGMGPIWEKAGLKFLQWAGEKGSVCTENSIHQFVEKPYLKQEEYSDILTDFTGWVMKKYLPRNYTSMEALQDMDFANMLGYSSFPGLIQFGNPEIVKMFETLAEIAGGVSENFRESSEFDAEMRRYGYPTLFSGSATVSFDILSDCLRGTLGTMEDLYEVPEEVEEMLRRFYPASLKNCLSQAAAGENLVVFIPLHKGLDGFMGTEQYRRFYWPTLKLLVEDLTAHNLIPYIYTEGKYDSRLDFLRELPAGKVLVHFENCDMKKAKKIVGDHCCITGGFSSRLLAAGSPETVEEEVKKLLDLCAPGGGYMFDLDMTIDDGAKPENVEAMFRAVRKYGVY